MMFWYSSQFLVFETDLSLRILLPSEHRLDIDDKDGCSHKLGFSCLGSGTGLHKQFCIKAAFIGVE